RMRRRMFAFKRPAAAGADPRVRFLDTREYDDDPTEFSYGIPQLLRLMNSGLTHGSARLAVRLARERWPDEAIAEMYLGALARRRGPGGGGQAQVVHPAVDGRRAVPGAHLRPQARRSLQGDRHERAGHPGERAPAQGGPADEAPGALAGDEDRRRQSPDRHLP